MPAAKQPQNLPLYSVILKQERQRLGLTQEKLAEKTGLSAISIHNWERGKSKPGAQSSHILAEFFGKSIEALGLVDDVQPNGAAQPPSLPLEWWYMPYKKNPLFTGRDQILQQLHNCFFTPGSTTNIQALTGLAGMGKTQVAIQYVYTYQSFYRCILWLRVDTIDTLLSDLGAFARLVQLPDLDRQDQSRTITAFKQWLTAQTDWLLVLDNVNDWKMVEELLAIGGQGHILLTTRLQAIGAAARKLELEKMPLDEATLFLLRRAQLLHEQDSPTSIDPEKVSYARRIAEMLDGLPLALDQAGAYMEETTRDPVKYLSLYKERKVYLLQRRGELTQQHPLPVFTTWSLSFNEIEQRSQVAIALLTFFSFLQPDAIPDLLLPPAAIEFGMALQQSPLHTVDMDNALLELLRFSLVQRNHKLGQFALHRLVQVVAQQWMPETAQKQAAERTVRIINRAFPPLGFDTWHIYQQLLPHAQLCMELIQKWHMRFDEATSLLRQTGVYLYERAQYQESEPFLLLALSLRKQNLPEDHPLVAESLSDLGLLSYMQGNYPQAEKQLQYALAIRERVLGPQHIRLVETLYGLAWLRKVNTRYPEAKEFLERALAIQEKELEPDNFKIAETLNELGVLHSDQGLFAETAYYYERSYALLTKVANPSHPFIAGSINNLAVLYRNQGRYAEAEPLFEQAIALLQQIHGPGHPDVATALFNLAKHYIALTQYAKARQLMLQALAIREKVLGSSHEKSVQIQKALLDLP